MDRTWHSHHFTCWSCESRFTAESGFHDYNGNPHCEKCYVDAACPKCKGCAKAITDKSVNAMGGSWHIDCFVCKVRKEGRSPCYLGAPCTAGEPGRVLSPL